jgi:hypothetical protein
MNRTHRVVASLGALATCALTAAASAVAQGTDDHTTASALVLALERDATRAPVVGAALSRAKAALEHANRLRGAGDETHAKAADGLAREWAETARDLGRAADAEQQAAEVRRKAVEAQAQLERSRALVEEAIARAGRLRAELEAVSHAPSKDKP